MRIEISESGLNCVIDVTAEGDARLLHLSAAPFHEPDCGGEEQRAWYRLVEVQATGFNQHHHHGSKYTGTSPARQLRYVRHEVTRTPRGRKLEIVQAGGGVEVVSHLQFVEGLPVVRAWTDVTNTGGDRIGLEYVSSLAISGLGKGGSRPWDRRCALRVPHNTWYGECQWRRYTLDELALNAVNPHATMKRLSYSVTGTWSSANYLPMGAFEDDETGETLVWQIEHNGSWHYELSTIAERLYLQLSGPTQNESHWWKELGKGETFTSVPVAFGAVVGGIDDAFAALTRYRRRIRRPHRDNAELPVIFNDYMNCLFADPTTEKELPLIDAAAEVGCEIYVIDAGWYDEGPWWDSVGLWQPAQKRFPNPGGLPGLLDHIRSKGMTPGLWLEPEVMGMKCPLANEWPDACFFMRRGRRVIDHGRYQLDFRHPKVIAHLDEVIDRLVGWGCGYIKTDYNINAGIGTEVDADSAGDGLLENNRAFLAWLDRVFDRHPDLVIESCASGGLRMDYAMLSRCPLQSMSDQTDYRKAALIAAAAPTAVTPEQGAVWSYPMKDGDAHETVFNMVNAILGRIHQSGHLAALSPERRAIVKEAIAVYKRIRGELREATPFWPLGLPRYGDEWACLGLRTSRGAYVSVWRLGSEAEQCRVALPEWAGKLRRAAALFPAGPDEAVGASGELVVTLPDPYSARLFELS